ncbi:MAG: hypothetical protein JWO36_789 [Myxococcales bacterium]|nr:hypothetical protein [Myxococcales bacterium]
MGSGFQDVAPRSETTSDQDWTTAVASLATAIQQALLNGDIGRARDLAAMLHAELREAT